MGKSGVSSRKIGLLGGSYLIVGLDGASLGSRIITKRDALLSEGRLWSLGCGRGPSVRDSCDWDALSISGGLLPMTLSLWLVVTASELSVDCGILAGVGKGRAVGGVGAG